MSVTKDVESGVASVEIPSLIGGRWVAGEGQPSHRRNPATGEALGVLTQVSNEQAETAVAAARAVKSDWAKTGIGERAESLKRLRELMDKNRAELAHAITQDMGKTLHQSLEEIEGAIEALDQALIDAIHNYGEVVPTCSDRVTKKVMVTNVPLGVVCAISPWNFPIGCGAELLAPALAFGNSTIWKPSEVTPTSSHLFAELLNEALPDGVVNVVHGDGAIGAHLVSHQDVDMVAFVGSVPTGEAISRAVGIKPVLLELGGNGPMIIMDDADVERAVEATVKGCFYISGQACTAAERVLVQSGVYDRFVERLAERAGEVLAGDPLEPHNYMGPIAIESVVQKTHAHIVDAVEKGATVTTGGNADGNLFEATVIVDVTPEMDIAREETFGPVAPVIKFDSQEEAIEIANATQYGLQAAVFTDSLKTALEMSDAIDSGVVHINESTNHWEMRGPFGGTKSSGVGRLFGSRSAFTRPKLVSLDF